MKLLVMDVDGTLTDGKIYMGENGEVCKAFSIKDGCGIHDLLIPSGILPVIITGRKSGIVKKRCQELGITALYQGVTDKAEMFKDILRERGYVCSEAAYIGDDLNDLSCMELVKKAGGIVGCPFDAVDKVKEISDYICEAKGGEGAVREFIEWMIKNNMNQRWGR